MSDSNVPSGNDVASSGSIEETATTSLTGESSPEISATVSREFAEKVLKEKKSVAKQNAELKARLAEIEKTQKLQEEEEAKKRGEWEKLAKEREKELKRLQSDLAREEKAKADGRKLTEFLKRLPSDLPDKYWNLVDLDQITHDPESGGPDEMSLKNYAENFANEYREVFVNPKGPKVSNEAPSSDTANAISLDQWKNLGSAAEMKKHYAAMKRGRQQGL